MYDIERLKSDVYDAGKTFGKAAKVFPTVAAIKEVMANASPEERETEVDKLRDAFYQGALESGLGLEAEGAKAQLSLKPGKRLSEATRLLDTAKSQWSQARGEAGLEKKRAASFGAKTDKKRSPERAPKNDKPEALSAVVSEPAIISVPAIAQGISIPMFEDDDPKSWAKELVARDRRTARRLLEALRAALADDNVSNFVGVPTTDQRPALQV